MIKKVLKIFGLILGLALLPFIFLYLFIIKSWDTGEDLETLFVQKIENSELLIVDFDVWYGRGVNTSGIAILKITKDFDFREIDKLPISYFENISSEIIDGITFLSPDTSNLKRILKNNSFDVEDIVVNSTFYKSYSSSGLCMLNEYKFNSFKET